MADEVEMSKELTETEEAIEVEGEFGVEPSFARLLVERSRLGIKLEKLSDFTDSETYISLKDKDRELLTQQFEAMSKYWMVLSERCARLFKGE